MMRHIIGLAAPALILLFSSRAVSQASCYYPDGSLALDDTPCRGDGTSTCCGYGFACLENGVCQVTQLAQNNNPDMNEDINYFRGSCTDQTWASPECPLFCIGTQYANGGGNSMQYCDANTFCCYGGSCDCTTGFNVTTFDESAAPFTTIGVPGSGTTATSASSSSSTSTSTETSSAAVTDASTSNAESATSVGASTTDSSSPSPTATSSDGGLSTGAKAGIGVGVGLGVVLFAVIAFLFFRTSRQHKELEGLKAQREPLQPNTYDQYPTQSQQPVMSGATELSGATSAVAWSRSNSPGRSHHHSGNASTSTPSHPSELHG